ncbi:hypothetical protein CVT26_013432 [Gymnopilus dilepis]|uniref:Uncharacterized protein n=1 Tax=Gymnopilus dilepis TaxID=231916 RepID=A0A409YWU2_9AGAR|nr:hypothetical protein CVT26_013432 [Gymnopilus dilepis]
MPALRAPGCLAPSPRILRLCIISLTTILFFVWYSSNSVAVLSSESYAKVQQLQVADSFSTADDLSNDNILDSPFDGLQDENVPGSLSTSQSSPSSRNASRILLVSALFPLSKSKSKHSIEDYKSWLRHFLGPITTPIYFYTTPDFAPLIQSLRGTGLPLVVNTTYSSPFDIPPLKGLEQTYEEMHDLDREKFRHSPELYAIWNAKPFLLSSAVQTLASQDEVYDYAFWNDAGSFRSEHPYTTWPDHWTVDRVWNAGTLFNGKGEEDLLFFPVFDLPPRKVRGWKEDMGPVDHEISEGSFFGGSPKTIHWWSKIYYAYHNYYLSSGLFVGKDQTLINALLLLFPSRFISVYFADSEAPQRDFLTHIPFHDYGYRGACGSSNGWYYYQYFMASPAERARQEEVWISQEFEEWWMWRWLLRWFVPERWWRRERACRLAGGENWENLATRRLGKGWEPPARRVAVPDS